MFVFNYSIYLRDSVGCNAPQRIQLQEKSCNSQLLTRSLRNRQRSRFPKSRRVCLFARSTRSCRNSNAQDRPAKRGPWAKTDLEVELPLGSLSARLTGRKIPPYLIASKCPMPAPCLRRRSGACGRRPAYFWHLLTCLSPCPHHAFTFRPHAAYEHRRYSKLARATSNAPMRSGYTEPNLQGRHDRGPCNPRRLTLC